jgi:hypothetical protein
LVQPYQPGRASQHIDELVPAQGQASIPSERSRQVGHANDAGSSSGLQRRSHHEWSYPRHARWQNVRLRPAALTVHFQLRAQAQALGDTKEGAHAEAAARKATVNEFALEELCGYRSQDASDREHSFNRGDSHGSVLQALD